VPLRRAAGPAAARRGAGAAVLVVGILLVAVNLRPAVAGIAPVLPDLRDRLGLSATAVALLTSIPVLCFGLFAPLAPPLRARLGEERTVAAAVLALLAGLLLRAAWPRVWLLAGTTLIGAAIAIGNVLLPSLIKRRLPARIGPMMSAYSMTLSFGPVLAGLTVPAYQAAGRSLRVALGMWVLPAAAALLVWLPQLRAGAGHGDPPAAPPDADPAAADPAAADPAGGQVWRSPLAWQVTLLMGLQSLGFYATLTWLPSYYRARGVAPAGAGALLALAGATGIVGALVAPALAARSNDQRAALLAALAACGAGLVGVLLAPLAQTIVWVGVLGLGQGALFSLALLLFVVRAADALTAAHLSSMAQTVGYLLAAAGPLAFGLLHQATAGWAAPFGLLLALTAVEVPLALGAGRRRTVAPAARAGPAG
jgi:CP family cyanate transporter-like MFS transporter